MAGLLSGVNRKKREPAVARRLDDVPASSRHAVHAVKGVGKKCNAGPSAHSIALPVDGTVRRNGARSGRLANRPITFKTRIDPRRRPFGPDLREGPFDSVVAQNEDAGNPSVAGRPVADASRTASQAVRKWRRTSGSRYWGIRRCRWSVRLGFLRRTRRTKPRG